MIHITISPHYCIHKLTRHNYAIKSNHINFYIFRCMFPLNVRHVVKTVQDMELVSV